VGGAAGKAKVNLDLSAMEAEKEAQSKRNDIKEIRNYKQLEKVDLDFDSPRMKKALHNLGVSKEECMKKERSEFDKKGLDEDIVNLRFKHHQNRLIDILNRILEERRKIKHEQMREEARAFNNPNNQNNTSGFNQTKSPGFSSLERTMNIPKLGFGASPMMLSPLA
jgi:hypothetical protein